MFVGGIVVVVLGWGCIQLIKYSPSTHKTLDLIPNPTFTISTHRGIEVILCNLDEHLGYVRLFFFPKEIMDQDKGSEETICNVILPHPTQLSSFLPTLSTLLETESYCSVS